MPIPILGIPGGNHMVYMRIISPKQLHYSIKVIKDFWNKPVGAEQRLDLVRQCPDPEGEDEVVPYLTQFIKDHDQAWAESWGISQEKKGLSIFDVGAELDDGEVAERLIEVLISFGKSKDVEALQMFKKNAITVFKGKPMDDILTVVDELSLETIVSLVTRSTELPEKVEIHCARRAWKALVHRDSALLESKEKLKSANEANDFLINEVQNKDKTIANLTKALNDDEKMIADISLKELLKELEARGYIEPKRRVCDLCQDTREHSAFTGDMEEMNEPINVEGLCPLIEPGQTCLQCTKAPPECFSNETLMICKATVENPCTLTKKNLNHSTLSLKRKHTEDIHRLSKNTDGPLIKKLKRKYGTWILEEYASDDEKIDW